MSDSNTTSEPKADYASQDRPDKAFFYGGDVYAKALDTLIDENRKKGRMIFLLLFIAGGSIALNTVQFNYLPATKVVSETADGRIRPLPSLDEPIFSDTHIQNWAAEHIEKAYDLPFTELTKYQTALQKFMMKNTASDFENGLRAAGILDKIRDERRIMKGIRTGLPIITSKGEKNGRYLWVVQMPLTYTFEGASGTPDVEKVIVKMWVGRAHLMQFEKGLVFGTIEVYPGGPQ
jgi:hypothetical protein